MDIVILTIDETSDHYKATIDSLSKNQFLNDNLHHNFGIVRDYDTSSRVMDSWKRGFKDVDQINFDLLLMEDDVVVLINFMDFKKKLKRDKINWVFYQKRFKEYRSQNWIPVGAQGVYIPKELFKEFKWKLLSSKSIHFDRWLSRLDNIYYSCEPKEFGIELEKMSSTLGRVRKGLKY